jgi:hypothetical protein
MRRGVIGLIDNRGFRLDVYSLRDIVQGGRRKTVLDLHSQLMRLSCLD